MDRLPIKPSCLRTTGRITVSAPSRRILPALLFLLCFSLLQGCRFPQDVEGTLEGVRGDTLEVGVAENPPWVVRTQDGAEGLEPEIIRNLAEQLGAEVRWHWGTENELLRALAQLQLDLVIGGIAKTKWITMAAASTRPYVKIKSSVGFPEGRPVPESIEGLTVEVMAVNDLARALQEKGARPVKRVPDQESIGAFAGPDWWLKAHGYTPGPFELTTDSYVMLLPKGENAWMMVVEEHLNKLGGIEQRLQQLEEQP